MRKGIRQDPNKNNCGQIAVAVIAGVTVENVEKLVGKKGCTKTKNLIKALRWLGYDCPEKCNSRVRPNLGLAKLKTPRHGKSSWHWVVVDGDKIFDGYQNTDGIVNYPCGYKLTSYLPITKKT